LSLLNDGAGAVAQNRPSSACGERRAAGAPRHLKQVCAFGLACLAFGATQARAADQVRISGLSDVAFGSIASFSADYVRTQDICAYAKSPPANNYRVTASGSGLGGAFLLAGGGSNLPFEVQWADTPGQANGTQLVPNQPAVGLHSNAGASDPGDCSKGGVATASLIVILRSTALAAAISGDYTGTLTLLVAPE
jgi:hypothetical protein